MNIEAKNPKQNSSKWNAIILRRLINPDQERFVPGL